MVRPRFTKLPLAQQQTILRAPVDEFAAHGLHNASLNRVIDTAGISKGSMYGYFDGKEDLYAYVARTELDARFVRVGPMPDLTSGDADAYWSLLEDYLRLMRALTASSKLAALLRGGLLRQRTPRSRLHKVTSSRHHCHESSRLSARANAWAQCARIYQPAC